MRYAIYFAADANDPLMQLGTRWLGRDPFSGTLLTQPDVDGLSCQQVQALTTDPRRYGFHGTLKAPFSLHESETEPALIAACSEFAATLAPFRIEGLSVNRLGKFLALTPDQSEAELRAFATACVMHFENFRAPLSADDLERRRKSGLSPKQDEYLSRWGYPYIFDEFRFHMTLSNKLENDEEAQLLADAAEAHFSAVTGRPRTCRHFGLYIETERGAPFQVQTTFELTGNTTPQDFQSRIRTESAKENA